jgi:hypothetical protein
MHGSVIGELLFEDARRAVSGLPIEPMNRLRGQGEQGFLNPPPRKTKTFLAA